MGFSAKIQYLNSGSKGDTGPQGMRNKVLRLVYPRVTRLTRVSDLMPKPVKILLNDEIQQTYNAINNTLKDNLGFSKFLRRPKPKTFIDRVCTNIIEVSGSEYDFLKPKLFDRLYVFELDRLDVHVNLGFSINKLHWFKSDHTDNRFYDKTLSYGSMNFLNYDFLTSPFFVRFDISSYYKSLFSARTDAGKMNYECGVERSNQLYALKHLIDTESISPDDMKYKYLYKIKIGFTSQEEALAFKLAMPIHKDLGWISLRRFKKDVV